MWPLAGGIICFVLDARCLVSLMLDACFIVHGSWLKTHASACGLAARLHRSESGAGDSSNRVVAFGDEVGIRSDWFLIFSYLS